VRNCGGVSDKEIGENSRPVKSAVPILEVSASAKSDAAVTSPSPPFDQNEVMSIQLDDVTVPPIDIDGDGNKKSILDDVLRDIEEIARQKRLLR
jgi:hypothetical protein